MAYSGSVTFTPPSDDLQDPDIIYYSGLIVNSSTTAGRDPNIRFLETRQVPLCKDASKYHFSIIRFNLNGSGKDLPIFIPVIEQGAVNNPTQNVNLTIYKLTITGSVNYVVPATGVAHTQTFTSTQPIIYVPETQDPELAPVPPASSTLTGQDVSTRYYWVYTYSHYCDLVNTAFTAAIADLQTQFNAWYLALPGAVAPAPTLGTTAPILTYNPDNNIFSLYCDTYGFGNADRTAPSTADENWDIYFNANLFGMLANFQNTYYGDDVLTNKITVKNIGKLYQNVAYVSSPPAAVAKSYWLMVQDYPSTSSLWSPVESIVFVSGLMPLSTEQSSDPIRFGATNLGNSTTSAGFEPIITDVALEQTSASDYRQFFQYSPTAEYRLISTLRSKTPITAFDISVFWRNRLDGRLYPLQMFNGSSASIKIMLRRRGIADYPHPRKEWGVDV